MGGTDGFDGFRELVAVHNAGWSRLAYLLAGSHAGAEDLLQNALLRVATRWRTVRGVANPDAYVRRTIYTIAVSQWRRRRILAEHPVPDVPEPPPGHDAFDHAARRLAVRRALARLTPRQRAVLVLRFLEDRTVVEAAEILGCSSGTVKSQTAYALSRLRALAPDLLDLMREDSAS